MKKEIWKDVVGYEGLYQVSNFGRVKSVKRITNLKNGFKRTQSCIILKYVKRKSGYCHVSLSVNGIVTTRTIHQLVAEAFLSHTPNGCKMVVNHINFIRNDNRLENIEIVTFRENNNHKHIPHSSIYTGVCWRKDRNRWSSVICVNGKQKHLGYFKNEIDAHHAYENQLKEINNESC